MKRSLGAFFLILMIGLAAWAFTEWSRRDPVRPAIRVGINNSPPYSSVEPDGNVSGFTVDVIREAARRARIPIRFVVAPEGPDKALASGKVDVWTLLLDLPERHRQIRFTDAWMKTTYVLIVKRGSPIVGAERAFAGRIAVGDFPVHKRLGASIFPHAQLVLRPTGDEMSGLCDGAADVVLIGRKEMLARLLRRPPECQSLDLQVVPLQNASYRMAIGARSESFASAQALREAISGMSEDSTLDLLYRRWLNDTGDETAIVDQLRTARRHNTALFITGIFLIAIIGLLAWLNYRKAAAERAAREASEFTSAILGTARQTAIVFVDKHRVVRIFNQGAERMLGYRAEEVVGRETSDMFFDPVEVTRRIEDLSAATGRTISRENLFLDPDREGRVEEWTVLGKGGTRTPVALAVSMVRGAGGDVLGSLGIAIDITEQKALEHELRLNNRQLAEEKTRADQAGRARDQFLASITHEIRSPLNAIVGIGELLAESGLDAEQRNYVDIFSRAASTLLTLVNDILDFSKLEAGSIELEKIEFDLEDLVEDAVELIAPKARAGKLRLMRRIAPDLPRRLTGDPARLKQVLVNLLGNAVKFTEAGHVFLEVRACASASGSAPLVEFAIGDTGIGIPPDKIETIFEDFKQADSSTTRRYGGTGLGLGISRRIVENMGGRLTARSVPGEGSTFFFSLPLAAARSPHPDSRCNPELAGRRILVLGENSTSRLLLTEMLRSSGMETREFDTSAAALEALRSRPLDERCDLVLLDSEGDESEAFKTSAQIHSVAPGLPIVMLSTFADGVAPKRLHSRLSGYALKPVRRSHLLRLISEALGEAQTAAPRSDKPRIANAESRTGLRILVVEDLPDSHAVIAAYLKNTPHLLTFASDGAAGVEAFCAGRFDLVLMDMRMPVMDGLTATRRIRQFEQSTGRPLTPILAVSANATAADIRESAAAGCQAHLAKPILRRDLLAAIRDYTQSAPALTTKRDPSDLLAAIAKRVPAYLADRRKDAETIPSLLETADFEAIRTLGHNMKGTGASFGVPEVTRIGAAIEHAAATREAESIRKLTEDLLRLAENFQPELQFR